MLAMRQDFDDCLNFRIQLDREQLFRDYVREDEI